MTTTATLSKKDFQTDQEVRWCPGCGDYAILSAVQSVFPELGIAREKFVVVSGIGCSSRFPYYMNTYGFHTIHGRAPAIATGLKLARPELEVWIATGDGDALSVGGNPLIYTLRRNVGVPRALTRRDSSSITRGERMRPATSIASPSLVNSSVTVRHLSCWPLAQWSNTKS